MAQVAPDHKPGYSGNRRLYFSRISSDGQSGPVGDGKTISKYQEDHIALRIDAVNLKDRLGDVQTDCRDRLHR